MTYRELVRIPDVTMMLSVVNVSRLASGLIPFGVIAYFASRNEYPLGGAAAAVYLVVTSVTAPAKGRFITHRSPRAVVVPMVVFYGISCGASTLVAETGAPSVLPLTMIAIGCAVVPPVGALVRTSWNRLAPEPNASRALHALDSVTEELTFAVAPVLTTVIWVTVGPAWTVPVGGCFAILGTALIMAVGLRRSSRIRAVFADRSAVVARDKATSSPWARVRSAVAPYRSRRALALIAPMFGLGISMGALSLILPAWAEAHVGQAAFSGILLGAVSLAGTLVGAVAGRLPTRLLSDMRQYQLACGFVALAMVLFTVSNDVITATVASVVLGAGMTPMFIASFVIVGQVIAVERHTEVNAALGSGFNLGNGFATLTVGVAIAALSSATALIVTAFVVCLLSALSLLLLPGRRDRHTRTAHLSGAHETGT